MAPATPNRISAGCWIEITPRESADWESSKAAASCKSTHCNWSPAVLMVESKNDRQVEQSSVLVDAVAKV